MVVGVEILDKELRGKPLLCLKNRILLREGRWNGNQYLEEELKPIVEMLRRIERDGPETPEERNALSLFEGASLDHEDSSGTWVGKLSGIFWDDTDKAIKAEKMNIVDRAMAEKILFQLNDGFSSFAISPKLDVLRDHDICRDIITKTWAIVINPAGGESLFLDKENDRKDGKCTIRNLSFNITEGEYENLTLSKGASDMELTLEALAKKIEELEGLIGGMKDLKEKGTIVPQTAAQNPEAMKALMAEFKELKDALLKKEEEAAAKKKEDEEKMQKKLNDEHALMTAHLSDEKHDDPNCPLCLKAAALKKAELEAKEAEKAKLEQDAAAKAEGTYPAQIKASATSIVPFLPRAFKIDTLDNKAVTRFAEDLSEVVKPLFEKESLTAEEIAEIVVGLDKLLLTVPHDGPDPEVIAELTKKEASEKAELQKEIDEKVAEEVKKEVVKLGATPGRRGKVIEIADPEKKDDKEEYISPQDRFGAVMDGFHKVITGQSQ